jgi:hypothetical protein
MCYEFLFFIFWILCYEDIMLALEYILYFNSSSFVYYLFNSREFELGQTIFPNYNIEFYELTKKIEVD